MSPLHPTRFPRHFIKQHGRRKYRKLVCGFLGNKTSHALSLELNMTSEEIDYWKERYQAFSASRNIAAK